MRSPFPLALNLLFLVSVAPASAETLVEGGREIANTFCSRCHAIGTQGESPNPKSPPFRLLGKKYPLSNLEEALSEGIVVGHEGEEMPPFAFSAQQIEALLAYLASVQRK
jgi:mono/diheme cytochrome c family protein